MKTPSQRQAEQTRRLNVRRREGKAKGITSPFRLGLYAHGKPDPVRDNPEILARARRGLTFPTCCPHEVAEHDNDGQCHRVGCDCKGLP